MKRIRVDNTQETLVLTGMIVSSQFLRDVKPILDVRLFPSNHSRRIAKWCLAYFEETGEAPGVHIQDLFNAEAEAGNLPEEDIPMVARVLDRVSREFDRAENFNFDYVLKAAERFFSSIALKNLCQQIMEVVDRDPMEANNLCRAYQPKMLPEGEGYNPFEDPKLLEKAFADTSQPLFKLGGAFGDLINHDLCRGSFIGFMGMEKIGKSWLLLEMVYRAAMGRLNVVLFQAGDMTDEQQARRIAIRVAGRSDKRKYCGNVLVPIYDCLCNQADQCDHPERTAETGIGVGSAKELLEKMGKSKKEKDLFFNESNAEGYQACDVCRRNNPQAYQGSIWYKRVSLKPLTAPQATKEIAKAHERMKGRVFKMRSFPAGALSVNKAESELDAWENSEGFVPDVIVFDYADIMDSGIKQDFRHQQNQIWMDLRSLSQKRNCLVVTATQANADAYGRTSLNMKNFSEDKRKYSHVTSFYTLNQITEEKVLGMLRVAQLIGREDDFDNRKQAVILQSIQTGRPFLGSYFK